MTKAVRILAVAALLGSATTAHATPSTTFWTPATTYVQPFLVPHLTYDTYVGESSTFQNDYGLTVGFLPFPQLQGEIGVDVFTPSLPGTDLLDNTYLNAKLGIPEGAFGDLWPGISAGIYGVGFKSDYSDLNVLHGEIGKTFPIVGNLTVGGYHALNEDLFVDADGEKAQSGFMASWTSKDLVLDVTGLYKLNFIADVQTGDNALGGAGGGIGIYFTPAIALLTGPVWFFEETRTTQFPARTGVPSDFLWTFQIDVDFDLRKPAKK